jgi:hypothetical protein
MSKDDTVWLNLVDWIYNLDNLSKRALRDSSQSIGRLPTHQDKSSAYFIHPNLNLEIEVGKNGHRTRFLRNNGTVVASGSSIMCIPTISVTVQPITCSNSDSDDVDKHADAVHSLAWYLSQRPPHLLPYIDSLPKSSDLPRLWPEHTMQRLLLGSPTVKYIQKSIRCIQKCYKQSQEIYSKTQQASDDKSIPTPSWDDYSHFHAMVTSRAFDYENTTLEKPGTYGTVPLHMVPVLDLCNHCRGGGDSTNELHRKNVSYTFRECHDERADTVNDPTTDASTGVVVDVIATKDIQPNESIRITYGAKPNSVLLVNYGFTIPNNMEPDGSSNDVLDFYAPLSSLSSKPSTICEESPITVLRTGPPSYTYGCFTTALQSFLTEQVPMNSATVRQNFIDNDDDMEQFLNDCDEEEEDNESDDGNDETYDDDDNDNELFDMDTTHDDFASDNNHSSRHNVTDEIQALQEFRKHLLRLIDIYALPKDANFDWTTFIPSEELLNNCCTLEERRQMYAAILIHSEIRILQFYIWAIERLQHQLTLKQDLNIATVDSTWTKPMLALAGDDSQRLNHQVEELVCAYIKLRHK